MSQLAIDIGNSRTKVAIFDAHRLIKVDRLERLDTDSLLRYFDGHDIRQSIVSSVNDDIGFLEDILAKRTNYTRFSSQLKNSIDNRYETPDTLGLDRLAGMVAAKALYPGNSCLVIDAGSCITYDAIDHTGIYKGGNISPGLNMRFKAMHTFTGRLPLIKLTDFEGFEGCDTATSMLSGVVNGALAELKGFIETYRLHYPGLKIILCGGDANFFDTRLKSSIFAHTLKTEPDLVLIGLNEVIHQQ
ncbi:MAG: type III pantothenate kinase [Daejeonella sp.]